MLKSDLINQIISDMRFDAEQVKAEQKAAYFDALANKEFAALDLKVRNLTIAVAKGEALKKVLDEETAKRGRMLQIIIEKRSSGAIKKSGAAENIICAKCNNSGYKNGKICECVLKKYKEYLVKESGFISTAPNSFLGADKIFADTEKKAEYGKIYNKFSEYCNVFPKGSRNIVLSGPAGTGKTYAAQIIANNLIDKGFSVLCVTAFSLIERFKNFIRSFAAAYQDTETDALFECDLLMIDDLGTEPAIRNITEEYLYNVINERLVRGKPFLVTTNLIPIEIEQRYGQRLTSRLLSREKTILVKMSGPDLRLNVVSKRD